MEEPKGQRSWASSNAAPSILKLGFSLLLLLLLLLLRHFSRVLLLATPWTAAYRAPPSMGIFQARVLEWVAIAFSKVLSTALIIPEALF